MKAPISPVRFLRDAAVFAPCYIALDWASYIDPVGPFNITPWNPQPALAIVWMFLGGLQHTPVVLATIFIADVLVRDAPGGYLIAAVTSTILGVGYATIAWLLRQFLGQAGLRSSRQLTVFCAVVLGGTALVGGAFIGALRGAGVFDEVSIPAAWLRFWIGDAVGILVTAPLLLAVADSEQRRGLFALARRLETALQVAVLVATMWLIFEGLGGDPREHFYVLFLPLIWIAVVGGMNGAIVATALVQLGVVAGLRSEAAPEFPVLEIQALVAALTLTGLYLGSMVDERGRAVESLKESLRLAAAGEMAGAIAHEVNQPLTALANYGESALVVLGAGGARTQLATIIEKMLREASRAAEVVRRLRELFRTGTTHLEAVNADELARSVQRIAHQLIGARAIRLQLRHDGELPPLYIDRLQVELVLRNLIANAVEALSTRLGPDAAIDVHILREGDDRVRIVVGDSGPGLAASTRRRLFEPFFSGKPTGMGLGLAVSRTIAEAHGGSLEAAPGPRAEFHLVLPCTKTI
ncbi:MAG: histidine kinase [Betaproteobacteria bacterium]|nr:MAG: histidine kinase [Betaproteobacteria bacterium]